MLEFAWVVPPARSGGPASRRRENNAKTSKAVDSMLSAGPYGRRSLARSGWVFRRSTSACTGRSKVSVGAATPQSGRNRLMKEKKPVGAQQDQAPTGIRQANEAGGRCRCVVSTARSVQMPTGEMQHKPEPLDTHHPRCHQFAIGCVVSGDTPRLAVFFCPIRVTPVHRVEILSKKS